MKPDIYFYIPSDIYNPEWPKSLNDNWISFGKGPNIWTYFTPIVLKEKGYDVKITTKIPDEGIVLSHSRYLPQKRLVNDKTILICIRADYGRNHMAHIHIVQNPKQPKMIGKDILERLFFPGLSFYIPYWPQPGLIPRDPNRGDKFENIVYMGALKNLHEDLRSESFKKELENEGIKFKIITSRANWNDYSQVDGVLALRPTSGDSDLRKPPSKLVNAWLARVPAILGPESAFRALRKSEYDYIEVKNIKQIKKAVLFLKDNPEIRKKMIENGILRSSEFTIDSIANRWIHFFENVAIPYYLKWIKSKIYRKTFYFFRSIRTGIKNL
jgi:hypothetical protein